MPKKKSAQKRHARHAKAVPVEFYRQLARAVVIMFCYVAALLAVISMLPVHPLLIEIHNTYYGFFGWGFIFVPFVLVSLGLLLQGAALPIARFSVFLGSVLMLSAVLGITGILQNDLSGMVGARLWGNLSDKVPSFIAVSLLLGLMLIGLAIALGQSMETVLQAIGNVLAHIWNFIARLFMPFTAKLHAAAVSSPDRISTARTINEMHEEDEDEEERPVKVELKKATKEATIKLGNDTRVVAKAPNLVKGFQPQVSPFPQGVWEYPPISLFTDSYRKNADRGDTKKNSQIIETTLESFGIAAKVVEIDQGPAVTRYCLDLTKGTKISKITSLQYDLALALAAHTGEVRVEAPIPGKALVGVEIPNKTLELVPIRSMLDSEVMKQSKSKLAIPLGFDAASTPKIADIAKMPHLLVAGTTNSGKSVMLNAIITTILFRASPDEVKLILVDPKRVEMASYNGLPHLMTQVIHEPKETLSALKWAIKEMGDRYKIFSEVGARNIAAYNEMSGFAAMPYIVIIIDEFADLMMFAPNEVEEYVCRLAQMARAVGIHLIIATQRPSVDVITGLIKANIPARVAFNVSSMVDSRVILDTPGAEKLLGRGDMLYLASDSPKPVRIQAPFVRDDEIQNLIHFIKGLGVAPVYTEEVLTQQVSVGRGGGGGTSVGDGDDMDDMFEEAKRVVFETNNASASFLQRKLKIGYARAARILDQMEAAGVVGPANGSKGREVLRGGVLN